MTLFDVTVNGRSLRVAIEPGADGRVEATVDGRSRSYDASWIDANTLSMIQLDGHPRVREVQIDTWDAGEARITASGRTFQVIAVADGKSNHRHPHRVTRAADAAPGRQNVVTTMPGRIVRVLVAAGDRVSAGQPTVVVEAMKMENEMRAPKDGLVRDVCVKEGMAIEAGTVLVVID